MPILSELGIELAKEQGADGIEEKNHCRSIFPMRAWTINEKSDLEACVTSKSLLLQR